MRFFVLVLGVLLMPLASAVPVDLYAHTSNFVEAPMNTQEPQARFNDPANLGLAAFSACIEDPSGAQTFTHRSQHTWYGYSNPSLVEYDVDENGQPRIWQERGLGGDVQLDGDTIPVHWYVALTTPGQPLAIAPNVFMRATLREGDDVSVGKEAYNIGKIVAQGESEVVTLTPLLEHPQISVHEIDGAHVYGFHFPMSIRDPVIDEDEGFNLRIDVVMDNPLCADPQSAEGGDYLNLFGMQTHQSEGLWNHLELDVLQPIVLETLHIQTVGKDIVIHLKAQSVFGSYDLKPGPWLEVDAAAGVERLARANHSLGHGPYPVQPAFESYIWSWQTIPHGSYPFTLTIQNLQGTANITHTGELRVSDAGPNFCIDGQCSAPAQAPDAKAPGLPLLGAMLVLAALAWIRRR